MLRAFRRRGGHRGMWRSVVWLLVGGAVDRWGMCGCGMCVRTPIAVEPSLMASREYST